MLLGVRSQQRIRNKVVTTNRKECRIGRENLSSALINFVGHARRVTRVKAAITIVHDRQLIEGLEETVSSVGELVGDLSRVKTEVELKKQLATATSAMEELTEKVRIMAFMPFLSFDLDLGSALSMLLEIR